MLVELAHKCYTELADFVVALALRVKICSSFTATNVYCNAVSSLGSCCGEDICILTSSQSIFEDLFETEELQDRQVDSRVETKTSLVRTKGGIELHPVSAVKLWLSLIIFPDDSELDDTLGDGNDLEGSFIFWVGFEEGAVFKS